MLLRLTIALLLISPPALAKTVRPPAGAAQLCQDHSWACDTNLAGGVAEPSALLALARSVNDDVNRRIAPRSDRSVHGRAEKWTLPKTAGDCEDFALLKKKMLIDAGVAAGRLRLAQVMARNVPSHVVLIVDAGSEEYVLDNLARTITTRAGSRYVFLKVQSGTRAGGWEAGI
jgi:predicted transglutaminase-like cysteine proteinase